MLMLLASIITDDDLMDKLEECIKEYRLLKTDDAKKRFYTMAHLAEIKGAIEASGGLSQLQSKLDSIEKGEQIVSRMSGN